MKKTLLILWVILSRAFVVGWMALTLWCLLEIRGDLQPSPDRSGRRSKEDESIGHTISSIESRVSSIEYDVSSIEGIATSVQENVTSIEVDVLSLEQSLTNIESTASSVEGDVDSIKTEGIPVEVRRR